MAPAEPRNWAAPKAKMPPSEATVRYEASLCGVGRCPISYVKVPAPAGVSEKLTSPEASADAVPSERPSRDTGYIPPGLNPVAETVTVGPGRGRATVAE